MRLTVRTDLACRILMSCASNAGHTVRSSDIAEACNASANHLAQVIHQLQQSGFITTVRGRLGGLQLCLAPDQISIGRVFRVFEAGTPFAECLGAKGNTCPLVNDCRLRGFLMRALEAFYHELDRVTLDDLVRGNCGLTGLLAMRPDPVAVCQVGG